MTRLGRKSLKDGSSKGSTRPPRWQGIWRECSITRRPRQAICELHSSLFGGCPILVSRSLRDRACPDFAEAPSEVEGAVEGVGISQPYPAAPAGDKDTIRSREWQAKIISVTNDLRRFWVGPTRVFAIPVPATTLPCLSLSILKHNTIEHAGTCPSESTTHTAVSQPSRQAEAGLRDTPRVSRSRSLQGFTQRLGARPRSYVCPRISIRNKNERTPVCGRRLIAHIARPIWVLGGQGQ